MVLLLSGGNKIEILEKISEIKKRYKSAGRSGYGFFEVDLSEGKEEEAKEKIASSSVFESKKLIILKNASQNEKFIKWAGENKSKLKKESNTLVFVESKSPPGKLKSLLDDICDKKQEFPLPKGELLKKWIARRIKEGGCSVNKENLNKFVDFCGEDMFRLASEADKLCAYKQRGEIKEKDIVDLVSPEIKTGIFQTMDFIAQRDKKRALYSLEKHFQKGEPEIIILSMIVSQFRNLIKIKAGGSFESSYSLSKKLNLHPFVCQKGKKLAEEFNMEELKKIYNELFYLDMKTKTGKVSFMDGIREFIVKI